MGELRILDPKAGDLKVIWNPDNPDEVCAAKEQFDNLRKKGYMAWNVGRLGKKGDNEITEFDPELEKMIITPPVKKG
jgi:hypothetical protein